MEEEMIRKIGEQGDIVVITVPVTITGGWKTIKQDLKLDILIEEIEDGKVTLIISDPSLRELS
jgi:hypothetical protein